MNNHIGDTIRHVECTKVNRCTKLLPLQVSLNMESRTPELDLPLSINEQIAAYKKEPESAANELGQTGDVQTPVPPAVDKNYLQETMGLLEGFMIGLAASIQDLRHEMEKDYGLKTLTTNLEEQAGE